MKYFLKKHYLEILFSVLLSLLVTLITKILGVTKTYIEIFITFISSASAFLTIIEAVKTAVNQVRYYNNANKNQLSENTFVNRKKDIEMIIQKLDVKEHTIEICGGEYEGKTWFAKKICDVINSKEAKTHLHKAFYLDMAQTTDKELNLFFEKNLINYKTLIVFDNVSDLNTLFSKQSLYHFNMIYINKNAHLNINPSQFSLSKFDISHIYELQDKIRGNYPEIESITESEIKVLFKITKGNIGKIHALLNEQRCIVWLRNIASNKLNDYDLELNTIQADLFVGEYAKASQELDTFKEKYCDYLNNNNELLYKYTIKRADCYHLLNEYNKAVDTIKDLDINTFNQFNKNNELEFLTAHFYKHLWDIERSLSILNKIAANNITGLFGQFGILIDLYFLETDMDKTQPLEHFFLLFEIAENRLNEVSGELYSKYLQYKTVYGYFKGTEKNSLLDYINEEIVSYENTNNRLKANAYFVKAEIFRLFGQYEDSLNFYIKCQSATNDNNIKIQVAIMLYYLYKIKKVFGEKYNTKYDEYIKSINEIESMCLHNGIVSNKYGKILVEKLKSLQQGSDNSSDMIHSFDTKIMVIL